MTNYQKKIYYVTQAQYDILQSGGTVGGYTGIDPDATYFVRPIPMNYELSWDYNDETLHLLTNGVDLGSPLTINQASYALEAAHASNADNANKLSEAALETTLTTTSDLNIPTSKAVATYVIGLGYVTSSGVTSVSGASPIVSSGGTTPEISLANNYGDTKNPYASKTAKHFLAAPNAAAGVPSFREIVASDIPALNYITKTGSRSSGYIPTWGNADGGSLGNGYSVETALTGGAGAIPRADAVKNYVDGILAASDAMIFKGTIGSGGTYEIAAFNALTTYNSGWTFKVITAGTIKGKVAEIGDLVMATANRTGTGAVDADWVITQTNIDGAVVGPTSAANNNVALFNGTTGKIIKDSLISFETSLSSASNIKVPTSKAVSDYIIGLKYAGSSSAGGSATNADNIKIAAKSSGTDHYLSFVDSNNSPAAYEALYTDIGLKYNITNKALTVGSAAVKWTLDAAEDAEFRIQAADGSTYFLPNGTTNTRQIATLTDISTLAPAVHTHTASQISDSTTLGRAILTLSDPSAITFPRFNDDNTVSALSAADFRTAIGAGTITSISAGTQVSGLSMTITNETTTPSIVTSISNATNFRNAISAAAAGHTHPTTLAADTSTSTITLAHASKYKLTAGGSSIIFTMPSETAQIQTDWNATSGLAQILNKPTTFTPTAHNFIDTTNHPVSGLTPGHFLKALSANTYGFAAHGLTASDVGALDSSSTLNSSNLSGDLPSAISETLPMTFISAVSLVQNISGKLLTTFVVDDTHIIDTPYPYVVIKRADEVEMTTTYMKTYMKAISGSTFLPSYDYDNPKFVYIMDASGVVWKPQFTQVDIDWIELRMYKMPDVYVKSNDSRLTDARTPLSHTHTVSQISNATTLGQNLVTLANGSAISFPRFNADNTVSKLDAAAFRTAIGAGTGNGTVTTVSGTANQISVATGTSTPVISLATAYGDTKNPYASKTAKYFLAAPVASAGVPTFRAISVSDIPTLNQNTTGTAANVTGIVAAANGGTGINNGSRTLTINTNAGALTFTNANSTLTIGSTSASVSGTNTGDQTTITGNAGSATYASAVTVAAENTTAATRYPLFVDAQTGNKAPKTDAGFTYNPSNDQLTLGTTLEWTLDGSSDGAFQIQSNGGATYSLPKGTVGTQYLPGVSSLANIGIVESLRSDWTRSSTTWSTSKNLYADQVQAGLLTGGLAYNTTAPTANNTSGIKFYVGTEPATKYAGWIYFIT